MLFSAPPGYVWITVCAVAAALYLAGAVRLRRRGDRWPWAHTALWMLGLFAIYLVRGTGFGRYAMVLLSAHMAQHMMLNMYAPIALVLGAPMTLALRALPAGRGPGSLRALLLRFLRSRFLAVVSSMPFAVGLFVFSLFGLYLTPLFSILMFRPWGRLGMQVHFLASGYLFAWTLIGPDPGPHRPPALARLVTIVPVGAAHAFFAVTVAFASQPIPGGYLAAVKPAWSNLAWDQALGGAVAGGSPRCRWAPSQWCSSSAGSAPSSAARRARRPQHPSRMR